MIYYLGGMFFSLASIAIAFLLGLVIARSWLKKSLPARVKVYIFLISWTLIGGLVPIFLGTGTLGIAANFWMTLVFTLGTASRSKIQVISN